MPNGAVNIKALGVIIAVCAVVWLLLWTMQGTLTGPIPTVSYEQVVTETTEPAESPKLAALRTAVRNTPQDPAKLKELASALIEDMQSQEEPQSGMVLEAIDVLRQMLSLNANDSFALLSMADISFQQQIFGKAIEYFEKYLALEPNDNSARGRYASALTFTGNTDKAIAQLDLVLKNDPENFHALAYLAIAEAQAGEKDRALQTGEHALKNAPNEEAKARFKRFLETLSASSPAEDASTKTATPTATPASSADKPAAPAKAAEPSLAAVEEFIQRNPVAGSRFRGAVKKDQQTLVLAFVSFPIAQMPDFARDKFIGSIKDKLKELGMTEIKRILFVEKSTGEELYQVELVSKTGTIT